MFMTGCVVLVMSSCHDKNSWQVGIGFGQGVITFISQLSFMIRLTWRWAFQA